MLKKVPLIGTFRSADSFGHVETPQSPESNQGS